MRHGCAFRKLSRPSKQRMAMLSQLATFLFKYERIKTTLPRARELSRYAEKIITLAKRDSLNSKSIVNQRINDPDVGAKVLTILKERYIARTGGYTRVWRLGPRPSDSAQMAFIELVDNPWDLKKALARPFESYIFFKRFNQQHNSAVPESSMNKS